MPLDPAKIRARMKALNLTAAETSRRADMAPQSLARILTGGRTDPNLSTAQRLARALRCSVDDLTD